MTRLTALDRDDYEVLNDRPWDDELAEAASMDLADPGMAIILAWQLAKQEGRETLTSTDFDVYLHRVLTEEI